METRMYESLPHLVEGWSKNIYLGGRRSFPEEPVRRALVPLALAGAMLFWLLPPLVLAAGSTGIGPPLAPAAAAAIGTECHLLDADVGWDADTDRLRAAYPVGSAMVLYIVLRSTWRGARRVEWRGRTYSGI